MVAVQTGAAIALFHHFAKGNATGSALQDRLSGNSVFARDPDSMITMTRHKEADAYVLESTLRNLKNQPPFVVKWEFPLIRKI
ncbi:MAG: hypothetical protein WCO68_11185 [Verrucomicrobiota bacterium]